MEQNRSSMVEIFGKQLWDYHSTLEMYMVLHWLKAYQVLSDRLKEIKVITWNGKSSMFHVKQMFVQNLWVDDSDYIHEI